MTVGQTTQPRAVSCGDPAQILHLFPCEARSLAIAEIGAFGCDDTAGLAGVSLHVPPGNFAELQIRV